MDPLTAIGPSFILDALPPETVGVEADPPKPQNRVDVENCRRRYGASALTSILRNLGGLSVLRHPTGICCGGSSRLGTDLREGVRESEQLQRVQRGGVRLVINVLTNDTDVESASLAISGVTPGSNGTVVISGGGTNVTYTPDLNWSGTDTFTYVVGDWYGGFGTGSVDVIVTPVNDPPIVALVAPTNGSVFQIGDLIGFTASPSDVDGVVTQVVFFAGDATVGQATGAPWQDASALTRTEQYSMTARAWDDSGAGATSSVVLVTVTQKVLTVTGAVAQDKVYDGTTAATVSGGSLVGVESGDTVALENASTGTFAQASAGTGITVTTYMTLGGADAGNYQLTLPALSADISKAGQTISFPFIPDQAITNNVGLNATVSSTWRPTRNPAGSGISGRWSAACQSVLAK